MVCTTWKIVGGIKTIPEVFIVREIGLATPPLEHNGDKSNNSYNDKSGERDIKYNTNNYIRGPDWTNRITGSNEMNDSTDGNVLRPKLESMKVAKTLTP